MDQHTLLPARTDRETNNNENKTSINPDGERIPFFINIVDQHTLQTARTDRETNNHENKTIINPDGEGYLSSSTSSTNIPCKQHEQIVKQTAMKTKQQSTPMGKGYLSSSSSTTYRS
jgi:hypothetical protein